MKSSELIKKYIEFFVSHGHTEIPSSSLIPENDPTVLFTTAGMHPLVPYLLGANHPAGNRLTNVQKCVRTGDIEEVGDATHCTFFEMLGNWSLGDYFKEESIAYSYDFLFDVLGLDRNQVAVSVFEGDENSPKDTKSIEVWLGKGLKEEQIFALPKECNWWGPAGITGPCGPDTEIFIDRKIDKCSDSCSPACDCGKYVEIWNNVFMEYNKNEDGSYSQLTQKNVDTGMGVERTLCILGGYNSVYETDVFSSAIALIEDLSNKNYGEEENVTKAMRIVADHIRTATMIMGDKRGVTPSNVDQGYVVRRLIRRAVRFGKALDIEEQGLIALSKLYIDQYSNRYSELLDNEKRVLGALRGEIGKFAKTITDGLKELNKVLGYLKDKRLNGKTAFRLYDTFGFPIEMTVELCVEQGYSVDIVGYEEAFVKHKESSKAGATQKFAGGLADNGEQTTRLHTAAHLMLAGLRAVLGEHINQRGSNITAERLRFDFNLDRPMTIEEKMQVEEYVNNAIGDQVEVLCNQMPIDEAKASGAVGIFDNKYGEQVKVYSIEGYSKEICGGPHVKNTSELGVFKIKKEQSSSAGVRRIKAILI